MNPAWCYVDQRFDENLWKKIQGPFDIYNVRLVLREANKEGRFASFFKSYPYIEDLLFIDEFFSEESKSREDIEDYLLPLLSYDDAEIAFLLVYNP